jgi:Raf kinase inhibitor-like YbhB/YbcL family protein
MHSSIKKCYSKDSNQGLKMANFLHTGVMIMQLMSPAFQHMGKIPSTYTCDGKDYSPPLKWTGAPKGTQSFVLIVDDPDAPVGFWDHWLLFNIPASTSELLENTKNLPEGTKAGANSWKRNDYGGPCPPDMEHQYRFRLYAIDIILDLNIGATKNEIRTAMKGHILAEATLLGNYERLEK